MALSMPLILRQAQYGQGGWAILILSLSKDEARLVMTSIPRPPQEYAGGTCSLPS